jgi:hypothetical protein
MAKVSKEFQCRMEGMLYAHKIVKEGGIEALDKEINMRNFLKVDIWAKKEDVEALNFDLSTTLYNSLLSTFLFTLHDIFGFGRERLQKLKKAYDKNVGNIYNLNWLGENHVRFEDYAKYINERFGFKFEPQLIANMQEAANEKIEGLGRVDPAEVVQWLWRQGFHEASDALEKNIEQGGGYAAKNSIHKS